MRLKNYSPIGHDVLLRVKSSHKTASGIIMPNPAQDRVMQVAKTGPLVNIFKEGEWVLVGPGGSGIDMTILNENNEKELFVQTSVHSIIGIYQKEDDEDQIFVISSDGKPVKDTVPEKNIIDNPGIEHQPFLKEEIKA